jgi:hypothetical protein
MATYYTMHYPMALQRIINTNIADAAGQGFYYPERAALLIASMASLQI